MGAFRKIAVRGLLILSLLAMPGPGHALLDPGDLSGDGMVDPADVHLLLMDFEGHLSLTPDQEQAADVHPLDPATGAPVGNGVLDDLDLTLLTAGVADGDLDDDGVSTDFEQVVLNLDPFDRFTLGGGVRDGDLDHESDGVTNSEEEAARTSPFLSDTDFDGVSDRYEIDWGLDPLDPIDGSLDLDDDQLTNVQEEIYGTDPNDPDTDGDGLLDGEEVVLGTDPANEDTDFDLLLDSFELAYSFNPIGPFETFDDDDLDGMTNLDEQTAGTDPLVADSDSDGLLDGEEILIGSNPLDASDPASAFDYDLDGVPDVADNCMRTYNPAQVDADGDGFGDGACDLCPGEDDTVADPDRDGICGAADNCPHWPTADLGDVDGDGIGDACQCGDVDDDGQLDAFDWALLAVHTDADSITSLPAPHKCDFNGDGICSVEDSDILYDYFFESGPLPQVCARHEKVVEHVLGRIGYGGDRYSRRVVAELGISGYIDEQLEPDLIAGADHELEEMLDAYRTGSTYPVIDLDYDEIAAKYRLFDDCVGGCYDVPDRVNRDLAEVKLLRAIHSRRQLAAVLRDFWFNHFNVLGTGDFIRQWATLEYEQDKIAPSILGTFEDFIKAIASARAMLRYLDQGSSWYDNVNGVAHYNENFARELLELHTMGTGSPQLPNYDESDVQNVTRILTGVGRNYIFQPPLPYFDAHHDREPPKKVVTLHGRLQWEFFEPGQLGTPTDNEPFLLYERIAGHEFTARFVSGKLARRFVAEDPSTTVVDIAVTEWLTGAGGVGDLREVMRAMLQSDEFLSQAHVRDKTKRPLDFAASLVRTLGRESEGESATRELPYGGFAGAGVARFYQSFNGLMGDLWSQGEPLYYVPPPTGLPEDSQSWTSASAILTRINQADRLANLVDLPETRWQVSAEASPAEIVDGLVQSLLPGGVSDATRAQLVAAVTAFPAGTAAERLQRLRSAAGMVLSTPEFMLH